MALIIKSGDFKWTPPTSVIKLINFFRDATDVTCVWFLIIYFDSEFESVLRTKKQKEEVTLPEVSLDQDIDKEGCMESEDSNKPQVTFLVSYHAFCTETGHMHVLI